MTQDVFLQCDNPACDFKIENRTKDPFIDAEIFINHPCPKCGWNLLTLDDYMSWKKLVNTIKWVNKWFGWLAIFSFGKKQGSFTAHCHKGIHIEEVKNSTHDQS